MALAQATAAAAVGAAAPAVAGNRGWPVSFNSRAGSSRGSGSISGTDFSQVTGNRRVDNTTSSRSSRSRRSNGAGCIAALVGDRSSAIRFGFLAPLSHTARLRTPTNGRGVAVRAPEQQQQQRSSWPEDGVRRGKRSLCSCGGSNYGSRSSRSSSGSSSSNSCGSSRRSLVVRASDGNAGISDGSSSSDASNPAGSSLNGPATATSPGPPPSSSVNGPASTADASSSGEETNGSASLNIGKSSPVGSDKGTSSSSTSSSSSSPSPTEDGASSPIESLREMFRAANERLERARQRALDKEEEARCYAERAIELRDAAEAAEARVNTAGEELEQLRVASAAVEERLKEAEVDVLMQRKKVGEVEEELMAAIAKARLSSATSVSGNASATSAPATQSLVGAGEKAGDVGADAGEVVEGVTVKAEGDAGKVGEPRVLAAAVSNVVLETVPEPAHITALRQRVREERGVLDDMVRAAATLRGEVVGLDGSIALAEARAAELMLLAEQAQEARAAAEEEVSEKMAQAEKAVALELEASQGVAQAKKALERAEKLAQDLAQVERSVQMIAAEKAELLANEVAEAAAALARVDVEVDRGTKGVGKEGAGAGDSAAAAAAATPAAAAAALPETGGKLVGKGPGSASGAVEPAKDVKKLDGELGKDILGGGYSSEEERSAFVPAADAASGKAEGGSSSSSSKEAAQVVSAATAAAAAATLPAAAAAAAAAGSGGVPKASSPTKKSKKKSSSRFYAASFFSPDERKELNPDEMLPILLASLRRALPKVFVGAVVLLLGAVALDVRMERKAALNAPPLVAAEMALEQRAVRPLVAEMEKVPTRVKALIDKLPRNEPHEEETQLYDVLWLLLASVVFVPLFQRLPGGSPVLGYLAAGALIGPYALSIIQHVHGTKEVAEFGVVFLMFNIGLELSLERLRSMRKYVFGLGSAQVLLTAVVAGVMVCLTTGVSGPAAMVIGCGLALSSTAVVLQVLQERGESTSRHGRATFSVLLFQDIAVVVLLILIPLLAPDTSAGGVGVMAILEALAIAAVKAAVAITGIIAGGRLLLRPIYKSMAENHNAEIFAATTLLVVLGTSVLTARAGLSMALGAFLAGLLLSETEFALQVESDINPYRGLLLGLFFMTVGMAIDPKLLVARFPVIIFSIVVLIAGKTALVAAVGRWFGLSLVAAVRAGLLLAPGGEFAFVAFGEAVQKGIITPQLSSLLFLVVGISMAITPWLAGFGQVIASKFDQQDVRSLQPQETETDDLQGHIIICGFGRVGQIIAQLLSERLIPFVALDVRSERVSAGRALDLPVYFGDAGSRDVLHKLGAERAAAAVITLDTPGANYRAVWALSRNFPNIKTFVRAHDVDHGINLEKAGATAVVPETLEPSLQLAAAVLSQAKLPPSEIAATLDDFRSRHLAELTELSALSGTSLGYGYLRNLTKPKDGSAASSSSSSSSGGSGKGAGGEDSKLSLSSSSSLNKDKDEGGSSSSDGPFVPSPSPA